METTNIITFLDIDGTLLFKEYDTNPEVWKKINNFEDKGMVISLVTARPYAYAEHLLQNLKNNNTYHMFDRGSFISSKSNFLVSVSIPGNLATGALDILKPEKQVRIGFSVGKYFFANEPYLAEISRYMKGTGFKSLDQNNVYENINSIWIRDMPEKYLPQFMKLVGNLFALRKSAGKKNGLIDIFINSNIGQKNTFLELLVKENHCSMEKTLGIGDSLEDLPFLRLSKKVACPANAVSEVKKISGMISAKNYSEGLLDILNSDYLTR